MAPEAKRPRLSNAALTFIAFYLVAAAVLVVVLLVRRGSGVQPPTVTATDTNKAPIGIAKVFVDGHEVCGALPCQLPESKGSHWVSIRAIGYETPDAIEVNGDVPVHFTLRRAGAALAPSPPVAAAPATATAPAPAASHATEVANVSELPTKSAPAAPRRWTVRRRPAKLSFYSRPSALVLLDGRPIGSTPRRVTVSPGRHSVLFVHKGRRIARSARAVSGRTVGVSARF